MTTNANFIVRLRGESVKEESIEILVKGEEVI